MSKPKPLRIACDVDGVLCDYMTAVLKILGLSEKHTDKDITNWCIAKSLGLPKKETYATIQAAVEDEDACFNMSPYPGARDFVATLQAQFDVHACTTPMCPDWMLQRAVWLERKMKIPLSNQDHVSDKTWVQADLLIDDKFENCVEFGLRKGGTAASRTKAMLFSRPWNKVASREAAQYLHACGVRRVSSYEEILRILIA